MIAQEMLAGRLIDEPLVQQLFHGSPLGPRVTEGLPHRHQIRVLLIKLVPESAKSSPTSDSPRQPPPGGVVTDPVGEIGHVLVPDIGGKRIDGNQIQLLEVDRVLPIDACVNRSEHDMPGPWVDQPSVLVVGLIRQRRRNLVHVELVQVQHPFRVDPEPSVEAGATGPRAERPYQPPAVRSDQDGAWSAGSRRQGQMSAVRT